MSDVTRLLGAAAGDRKAAADLLPLVYDVLRKLAAARKEAESPGHTLDATALVHEAYLRLVGDQQFDGRGHFFAAAAEAMRLILVDAARRTASGMPHRVNVISTVTSAGVLRFRVFAGRFTSAVFIAFLGRLLRGTTGEVFLVADGHPVHRSRRVREWVVAHADRLRQFFLPPYCP